MRQRGVFRLTSAVCIAFESRFERVFLLRGIQITIFIVRCGVVGRQLIAVAVVSIRLVFGSLCVILDLKRVGMMNKRIILMNNRVNVGEVKVCDWLINVVVITARDKFFVVIVIVAIVGRICVEQNLDLVGLGDWYLDEDFVFLP